jgi:ABC-2 type transport system permease protein
MNQKLSFWKNPVLRNEFQLRMSTIRTSWIIFSYLVMMGGIVFTYLFQMEGDLIDIIEIEENIKIFSVLVMVQTIVMSFFLPGITSGLISGERERQILDILRTTTLSPGRIIMSQFIGFLSFMVLLLFASLPLHVGVFIFGGVSGQELLLGFAHLLVTMIFQGSLGIFCSTFFKRAGVATVVSYIIVGLLVIGIPLLLITIESYELFETSSVMVLDLLPAISFLDGSNSLYLIVYSILTILLLIGSKYSLSARFSERIPKKRK